MSSLSRVYTFFHDKEVSPVKLEIELGSIVNTWNNHEQGIQQHSGIWTKWMRLGLVVKTDTGGYTVLSSDGVIVINKAVAASTTVTLEAAPAAGRFIVVKDGKGDAGANNITISGNGKNIDGSATKTISTNYDARRIVYNGTEWSII